MAPGRLIRGDDASHIRAGHQGTTLARSHWVWGGWRPTLDARAALWCRRKRDLLGSISTPSLNLFISPSHHLTRVPWGDRDGIKWVWQWVDTNLVTRAATAAARMGERGHVMVLWASQSVFVRSGKAWECLGVVDGAFGRNGMITLWIHQTFATYACLLYCYATPHLSAYLCTKFSE